MNAPWELLFVWLVDLGCLASVLLVAALLLRFLLRDPASRVTLAWGTWLAIIAGGLLLALPFWPRIDVSGWASAPVDATPVVLLEDAAPVEYVVLRTESLEPAALPAANSAPVAIAPALSPAALGARVWLLIATLACGWLAMGMLRAWRLIGRSQPAPAWIGGELRQIVGPRRRRLPGVLTNKQLATAIALGTLRPRIVLPLASAGESNAPAVRAALAHEWAHIASGDLWLLALERALMPILALHPLFWWLRRLTRLDQELAADAAAAGDKPAEYAEALLAWAKHEPQNHSHVAALAMWQRPSNLSRRIHMILDPKRTRSAGRGRLSACAVLATLFTLALGLSVVSWRPTTAQDQPTAESSHLPAAEADGEIRFYPLVGPARLTRTLSAPPAAEPAIMIELHLLSFDRQAVAEAKVDLPISPDRAAEVHESGLVTAQLGDKEAKQLVEIVLGLRGAEMLSRPKLITWDGQEAKVIVGDELPALKVQKSTDGDHDVGKIEYQALGAHFRIKPRIQPDNRKMVLLEIVGEQSARDERAQEAADPPAVPPRVTHKIELETTAELGKTLMLLVPPETRVVRGQPERHPPDQLLLVLLRPSLVEHKYVEVDPVLGAAARNPAAIPNANAGLNAGDEAKLAEQLRAIRESLEALARERDVSRQENAALKAELERLKAQMSRLPQPAPSNTPSPYRNPQQVPDGGTFVLGGVKVKRADMAKPAPQITQVFKFANAKQAADVVNALNEVGEVERLRVMIRLEDDQLRITGPEAALNELKPKLTAGGSPIIEVWHGPEGARVVADQAASFDAVRGTIESLKNSKISILDPSSDGDRESSLAAKRQTERRLLELDLQAAELELEAADADFRDAEKLHERKSISEQEYRNKELTVERAKIQVARIKVQLEALQEPPPVTAR